MSGRDHSCEMCGRGGMNERGLGATPASPCPACGAPSCGHTDSCTCTECCLRRALERSMAEVERLKGELEVTTVREKMYRTLADRRGVRGDEAVALLSQTRADLAAVANTARTLGDEVERLTRQNENLKPVSPAVALNNIAKALGEPLQCGHPLVCWDETKGRCDWCQDKADLAEAQKREDARKAWREKYAERCETRGGDVQGCGTWIHYRDVLDAIGRGDGPK
jgi:uncharacterized Zn finger protein (UPF0148 family)